MDKTLMDKTLMDRRNRPIRDILGFYNCNFIITRENYINLLLDYIRVDKEGKIFCILEDELRNRHIKLYVSKPYEEIKPFHEWVMELSSGNIGAVEFLMQFSQIFEDFSELNSFFCILKRKHLCAEYLYMLWNDSCECDMNKVHNVIELIKENVISDTVLYERIFSKGRAEKFDDFLEAKK